MFGNCHKVYALNCNFLSRQLSNAEITLTQCRFTCYSSVSFKKCAIYHSCQELNSSNANFNDSSESYGHSKCSKMSNIYVSFKNVKAKQVDPDQEKSGQGLNFLQSTTCFPD